MKIFVCLLLCAISEAAVCLAAQPEPAKMNAFVSQLMRKMTLEEKVGQLFQVAADMAKTGPDATPEFMKLVGEGKAGTVLNSFALDSMVRIQKHAVENTRLKIPVLFAADIVHGLNTKFPVPIAESCSWDLELIEKSARYAATEAASIGLDWTYAPMVDVARDPRWGRSVEGAGEDPWWGAQVAAARVRGFQGKKGLAAPDALMATAKHFAGYGASGAGRDYNSVDMSERELREVHLPPFKAAVDAGAAALMSSFNDIAGMPVSANRWLLTDVLRKEWGFKGVLISDWGSVRELMVHGVADNSKDAAALAFNAGIDIDMEGRPYMNHLAELVRAGRIPMAKLDASVRRVLEAKYKRGLFQDPFRFMKRERAAETLMDKEHLEHAREIGRHSVVLLKNDNSLLPLKPEGKIALIGPFADLIFGLKPGSGFDYLKVAPMTLRQAMQDHSKNRFQLLFAKGAKVMTNGEVNDTRSDLELLKEALTVARRAEILVVHLGEPFEHYGEGGSKTEIRLPANQLALLEQLHKTGKPSVLVLTHGRPLVLKRENELATAMLATWNLGTQAGYAIKDVLFGHHNPSGKLTMSFPFHEGQIPIHYAYRNTGRPPSAEDRYSSKYLDAPNDPLFPFGWGLSYTRFTYSDLNVTPKMDSKHPVVTAKVKITNVGDRRGHEVAQLYVRDVVASISRPLKQLKGIKKVLLEPGESTVVEFKITRADLEFFGPERRWAAEPGRFRVMVGGNSMQTIDDEFTLAK